MRSIVGRFLEHHRVYHFHAGGERKTYLASADWMERNLFRRVETCFPVEDEELRARVLAEGIEAPLEDTSQAWVLGEDGTYTPVRGAGRTQGPARASQTELRERLGGLGGRKLEARKKKGRSLPRKVG